MALLSEKWRATIDEWLLKYPATQKQSALLPALRFAQEENDGWLSDELIMAIADYLQLPHIAAFEVVTFYTMYERAPVGRHKISVCTNISCMLAGCEKIVSHLKEKLGIQFGETTADGRFTLREVECLGACGMAPVAHVGHDYHEHLTPEKVDHLLETLK